MLENKCKGHHDHHTLHPFCECIPVPASSLLFDESAAQAAKSGVMSNTCTHGNLIVNVSHERDGGHVGHMDKNAVLNLVRQTSVIGIFCRRCFGRRI